MALYYKLSKNYNPLFSGGFIYKMSPWYYCQCNSAQEKSVEGSIKG